MKEIKAPLCRQPAKGPCISPVLSKPRVEMRFKLHKISLPVLCTLTFTGAVLQLSDKLHGNLGWVDATFPREVLCLLTDGLRTSISLCLPYSEE